MGGILGGPSRQQSPPEQSFTFAHFHPSETSHVSPECKESRVEGVAEVSSPVLPQEGRGVSLSGTETWGERLWFPDSGHLGCLLFSPILNNQSNQHLCG